MEAAQILEYLRERELTVSLVDGNYLELAPAEKLTNDLIERLRKHKPAIIQELKREERREKVLKMLADNPAIHRAFVTDAESDRHNVVMTLAVRGTGVCELLIPQEKYDGFAVLEVIKRTAIQ